MDRKRKARYLIAVYTIVSILAIVFALVGVNYAEQAWQSILLNLATELLGVALVFFLVNRLFLVDEWNISERIDKLVQHLEISRPSAKDFFQKWPDLDPFVRRSNQIDLCGVTLTSTLNKQFGNLRERLQAGAEIRILVIDPDSVAPKMSAERSTSPEDTDYYLVRLDATLREIEYLFRRWEDSKTLEGDSSRAGSLCVRLLSYSPSFGIISLDANQDNGVAFVEVYPHKFGHKSPPTFELTPKRDGSWYKYFVDQLDQMWDVAKPWQPRG